MARQIVVFALVLFAVVGFACGQSPAAAPKGSVDNSNVGAALLAPGAENEIGNTDGAEAPAGGDDVVEGPVGGPEAAGAGFGPSSEPPQSGASVVEISAVAGIAAVTGFFLF